MATTEAKVLNSLCTTKDIQPLFAANGIDKMFVAFPEVWQFVKEYYSKHRAVPDSSILDAKFKDFDAIEVPGETTYYVDMLRDEFINSELENVTLKLKTKIGKVSNSFILDNAIADFTKLQNMAVQSNDLDITDFDAAAEDYKATALLAEQMGGVPGIPTGISFIDSAYNTGLVAGDLIIVLGWTGRAKSLLTTLIACNAFNAGYKPMIVSLEMNTKKVRDRAYTILGKGRFKNSDLAIGDIDQDDFKSWHKEINRHGGFEVINHDGNNEVTPAWLQAKIDQYKPKIVVLDYAQLMSDNANSTDMVARMRNMSKEYKRLAQAAGIPIILISSATPDNTASLNNPPMVEQVAWSKQLSYDADLSFAVHRHDGVNEDGSVIIEIAGRKNRNGELFSGYFKANINDGKYEELFNLPDAV